MLANKEIDDNKESEYSESLSEIIQQISLEIAKALRDAEYTGIDTIRPFVENRTFP